MAVQREPLTATLPADPSIGDEYDVLVIGGGPAGLATAIELRRSSEVRVLVAESCDQPAERFGESLPPDVLVPLDRLGVRDRFRSDGHLPCPGSISVWGDEKPGYNDFILNPMGPAWHISRTRFESMLRSRACAVGATFAGRTRVVGTRWVDGGYDIALRHRAGAVQRVRSSWIVDATGWHAFFARRQEANRLVSDQMLAVVRLARIRSGMFSSQTVVEATPQGWWYSARLPDDRLVTVLFTERRERGRLALDGHTAWRAELAATTLVAERLAGCTFDEERFRSYPVVSSMLDRVEAERWLAVGDAASTFDPIASQGIHKALIDAADAARTIRAGLGDGALPQWRYTDRIRSRFEDYVINRAYLYGLERRWPDATFWRKRLARGNRLAEPA